MGRERWIIRALCGALSVSAAAPGRADPTGPQVMERCRKAYAGLKSYQSAISVKMTVVGSNSTPDPIISNGSIQFVRPGRFRIETTTVDGSRAAYRSNGKSAWLLDETGKAWQPVDRKQAWRISGATPIVMLLNGAKPGAFSGKIRLANKTRTEKIDGHPAYRVEAASRYSSVVYWVDRKTFLLRKTYSHMRLQHLPGGGVRFPPDEHAKDEPASQREYIDTEKVFAAVKINPPLPAALFTKP